MTPLCLANLLEIWQCSNHNMPELQTGHPSLVCRHDLRSLEFGMKYRQIVVSMHAARSQYLTAIAIAKVPSGALL